MELMNEWLSSDRQKTEQRQKPDTRRCKYSKYTNFHWKFQLTHLLSISPTLNANIVTFDILVSLPANRFRLPVGSPPVFSHVGILLDDAAGWRVFSGVSRSPRPYIPAMLLASLHTVMNDLWSYSHKIGSPPVPSCRAISGHRIHACCMHLPLKLARRRKALRPGSCWPISARCLGIVVPDCRLVEGMFLSALLLRNAVAISGVLRVKNSAVESVAGGIKCYTYTALECRSSIHGDDCIIVVTTWLFVNCGEIRRSHVEEEPAPKDISEIDPNRIICWKTFPVHDGKAVCYMGSWEDAIASLAVHFAADSCLHSHDDRDSHRRPYSLPDNLLTLFMLPEADSRRRLTTAGHTHLHAFLVRSPDDKRRRSQCYVGLYRARLLADGWDLCNCLSRPCHGSAIEIVTRLAVQLRPRFTTTTCRVRQLSVHHPSVNHVTNIQSEVVFNSVCPPVRQNLSEFQLLTDEQIGGLGQTALLVPPPPYFFGEPAGEKLSVLSEMFAIQYYTMPTERSVLAFHVINFQVLKVSFPLLFHFLDGET
ncbi:hypothetical protein PR048_020646 [Dryococelus australis]|uniref:Uncharacterized protein n=1 Tax=Dryococelus australis TaxID=614101 RepID=A0ABQ9H6T8_9NEOP|nr:hypothetical protein PR048_020646 [Dryococelus australis]